MGAEKRLLREQEEEGDEDEERGSEDEERGSEDKERGSKDKERASDNGREGEGVEREGEENGSIHPCLQKKQQRVRCPRPATDRYKQRRGVLQTLF